LSFVREELHAVMTALNQSHFQAPEIAFLREWAQIMGPVAQALDIIQGEETGYLGYLLPTVVATKIKLTAAREKRPVHCSPLIDALLDGIDKRFGHLLQDLDCQLAAAFHPRFRLKWLRMYESRPGTDASQSSKVRIAMEKAVESAFLDGTSTAGSSSSSSEEDGATDDGSRDFFADFNEDPVTSASSARRYRTVPTCLCLNCQNCKFYWPGFRIHI
jgi:hypothetical protein